MKQKIAKTITIVLKFTTFVSLRSLAIWWSDILWEQLESISRDSWDVFWSLLGWTFFGGFHFCIFKQFLTKIDQKQNQKTDKFVQNFEPKVMSKMALEFI